MKKLTLADSILNLSKNTLIDLGFFRDKTDYPEDKLPSVSLVIPAYNEEEQIRKCLEFIAKQTIMPEEVIVVDNNSTDNTVKIVKEFPFAKVVTAKRQGIVHARNTGFDAATSDIIGRIDSDSHIAQNWVKDVKRLYMRLPASMAVTGPCEFRDVNSKGFWFMVHRFFYFWFSHWFLGHRTLFGSNMAIPQDLWKQIRKNTCTDLGYHEDMDLSIHIKWFGGRVVFVERLRATISPRRIFSMGRYPRMWVKTVYNHHIRRANTRLTSFSKKFVD